jgi:peptidoglycan hydrolase CwlO-like protein
MALVEIFSLILVMMVLSVITYFVYTNSRKLRDVESTYDGSNGKLDQRISNIISGINYNDRVINSSQEEVKTEIDLMSSEINALTDMITKNSDRISMLKADYAIAAGSV